MSEHTKNLGKKYRDYVDSSPPLDYQNKSSKFSQIGVTILRECFGDPTQYHGKAFVTPNLREHSNTTCRVAVLANWINVLTAVPAFHFGFSSLGPAGFILTIALSGISLKWSNEKAAAAAAAASKGNRLWSNQSLLFFVAINAILTVISGIGSELLTNQAGLSSQLAKEKLEQLKPDLSLYISAEERCKEINDQLRTILANDPKRNSLEVEARGRWDDRISNKDWSKTPTEQIPVCVLKDRRNLDQKFLDFERSEQKRRKVGNDVEFLKNEQPQLFESHFTLDGKVRDGAKAFELAFEGFFGRLLVADFKNLGQMGFPLLMFSLSVVTSMGACVMLIAHARREDTQQSYNEQVHTAVLAHLSYLEYIASPEIQQKALIEDLDVIPEHPVLKSTEDEISFNTSSAADLDSTESVQKLRRTYPAAD